MSKLYFKIGSEYMGKSCKKWLRKAGVNYVKNYKALVTEHGIQVSKIAKIKAGDSRL